MEDKREPAAMSVQEFAKVMRISRSSAYAEARSGMLAGSIRVIKIGSRMIVPRRAVYELLGLPVDHIEALP